MSDEKTVSKPPASEDAVMVAKPAPGSEVKTPARAKAAGPKGRALAANPRRGGGPVGRPGQGRRRLKQMEARPRSRHYLLILSFIVLVLCPAAFANWYLHYKAADQYASNLAFTIQSEDGAILTGLESIFAGGSGGSADDAEVLYGFIQSQNLVETLDARLGLRQRYNMPEEDWFFRLGENESIEELVDYWREMVLVAFDAGIVEVEVRAFDPQDAQLIANAVLEESTAQINRMSEEAREDAVKDSRGDLERAVQRLKKIRAEIALFRAQERRVDPEADVQASMQRIAELEGALTEERLSLDQLLDFAPEGDSRIAIAERRIRTFETAIEVERGKLANGELEGEALTVAVGRFEELSVDRELAEGAYAAALASFEAAKADARRKHRYLSAHIAPTLSQTPQYPERYVVGGLVFFFLFMGWVVLVMIAYNVKDRR